MLEACNLLPPGLALSPAGQLSGSPTIVGTYSFIIGATDGNLIYGQRSYTLTVGTPSSAISLDPPSLSNGMMGQAYSQTITAAGGTAPYTFSIVAGTLPAGLALDPVGSLSGTPTAAGTFDFTVGAVDSNDLFAQQAYSLTVKPSPLHLPIIINP